MAGHAATTRAPRLGLAAAMLAATLAVTPLRNASLADQRTGRRARLSWTIAAEATTNMPSTESGNTYATSGLSPKRKATWTIWLHDDQAAIAATAPVLVALAIRVSLPERSPWPSAVADSGVIGTHREPVACESLEAAGRR